MNNYIISWHDSVKNTGGVKAKKDADKFISELGYKKLNFPKKSLNKVLFSLFFFPVWLIFTKVDRMVIQFPSGKPFIREILMFYITKITNAKVIFVIHDIEALRLYSDIEHQKLANKELILIFKADGLIVLNDRMKVWLKTRGYQGPMESMEVWDYDTDNSLIPREKSKYEKTVCFAGNLRKSVFLKKIVFKKLKLSVYGPNPLHKYSDSIKYEGQFSPEKLPIQLKQNFGLVWDGLEVTTCSGKFGEYLKYNNPHKLSLYLGSGVPVIIWDKAETAKFVKKNKLGLVIDNLNNLEGLLNNISQQEYIEIEQNVILMARKMRNGYFIKTALRNLEKKL